MMPIPGYHTFFTEYIINYLSLTVNAANLIKPVEIQSGYLYNLVKNVPVLERKPGVVYKMAKNGIKTSALQSASPWRIMEIRTEKERVFP